MFLLTLLKMTLDKACGAIKLGNVIRDLVELASKRTAYNTKMKSWLPLHFFFGLKAQKELQKTGYLFFFFKLV